MGGSKSKNVDGKISVENTIEMKRFTIEVDELELFSEIYITKDRKSVFTKKGSSLYSYIQCMLNYSADLFNCIEESSLLPSDIKELNKLIRGIDDQNETENYEEDQEEYSEDSDSSTFGSENESKYALKDKVSTNSFDFGSENVHNRFYNNNPYMKDFSIEISLISKGNQILSGGNFVKILDKSLVKSYLFLRSIYKPIIFMRKGERELKNDEFSKWCLTNQLVIDNFLVSKTELDKEISKLLDIFILRFQSDQKLVDSLYEKDDQGTFIDTDNLYEVAKKIYNNTNLDLAELLIPAVKKLKNMTERENTLFQSFNFAMLNKK